MTSGTAACGGGQTYRTRGILEEAKHGGKTCEDQIMKETKPCNVEKCGVPIDCELSDWEAWSSCSATCDGGQQFRTRSIIQHAAAGGHPCHVSMDEVRACGTEPCKTPVDCVWGQWAAWGACSSSCGGGQRERSRSIETSPRNGGTYTSFMMVEEV